MKITFVSDNECLVCSEVFAKKSEAEEHYMEVHLKIRYLCDICKAYFAKNDDLKEHCALMHNPNTTNQSKRISATRGATDGPAFPHINARDTVEKFSEKLCAICHKHFETFSDTRDHLSSAHNIKIWVCDICDKGYMHYKSLIHHQESHLEVEENENVS